jgi:hypothetical protein
MVVLAIVVVGVMSTLVLRLRSTLVCLEVLEISLGPWEVAIIVLRHRTRNLNLKMSWTYRSSFDGGSWYVKLKSIIID